MVETGFLDTFWKKLWMKINYKNKISQPRRDKSTSVSNLYAFD